MRGCARELKVFPQMTPAGIEPQADTFRPTDIDDALRRATRLTPQAESGPEGFAGSARLLDPGPEGAVLGSTGLAVD
jgi:hypothetical protein